MIVFNKCTGDIIAQIPDEQDALMFFQNYPEDFKANISYIMSEHIPIRLAEYKIVDNKIIKRNKDETWEVREHGRTLTEEERQLNQLKPSHEEIKKAETTIEILLLLQEVL